ncbi:putative P-loop containing nucleoside triphosphate hydrolase protein [Seiridium unicorne]|uniref:P-loop containing nucleoside triphosphate hydrolase protein n=1 Tax=Seiridium unicorne TaxID=138068 RepID=A0ABR2UEQ0_9PEZI
MPRKPEVIDISDDDGMASRDYLHGPSSSSIGANLKKRKKAPDVIEKIEWTDDEDELEVAASKKRKTGEKASESKGKGKATKATKGKHGKSGNRKKGETSSTVEDEELPEEALPEYLKQRRKDFNEDRERLKLAGLKLPPTYEDVEFSEDESFEKLEEKPKFDERSGIKPSRAYKDIFLEQSAGVIPASIAQYLRDYQVVGVRFLHRLFVYQEGGILGDDMGLGKTVQVAAFLTAMFGKTGDQRDAKRMRKFRNTNSRWYPKVLIVCPGSLTQNWKQELDRWGWWVTDLYHGPNKDDVLSGARAGRLEVMITTYTTYKNNYDAVNRVTWDVVVADECHCLKDPAAEVTRAMNDVNSLCRIGLTGTAIQNKYEELWCILNWTNPGVFGTISEWKQTISVPLTIGQSHDATIQQLSTARKTAKKLVENLLPRFFLRRMKSLIAHQLPKKSDRVVFCPLSDMQNLAYQNFVNSPLCAMVKNAFIDCDCDSGNKRGWCCYTKTPAGEPWKALVFPMVMSLQKLSSHLTLLIPAHSETMDKHNRDIRYLQAAMPDKWKELYTNRDSLLNLANPDFCGKWGVLKKLLKYWHSNGDKVLVFSHSVRLLRILQHLFNNTSYNVSYLDGSLSYEERQNTVDDFNSDPNQFVFLISTKAGGVGLNITSANKVVIMDPHWNPSYDLQAQDRAYRIGQVRDVEVYRLVSAGTIEEITYARQIYKQQQANIGYTASNERRYFKGVQHQPDRKGEIFGIDNLLSYKPDQVKLRDIVNKTNIAEAKAGVSLMDVDMDQAVEDASQNGLVKKEDDPGHGDGGLSQLAAILTKEEQEDADKKRSKKRKSDVVQAILVSAGVEYTHENSEVVGSSKVEDKISHRAEREASQDLNPTARAIFFDSQDPDTYDDGVELASLSFQYNPPDEVLHRQFCTMAKTFGFPSATEFALVVESMTQEQRRNTLDLFYTKRLDHLKDLGLIKPELEENPKLEIKDEMKGEQKTDVKVEGERKVKYSEQVLEEKVATGLQESKSAIDEEKGKEDRSPSTPKLEVKTEKKSLSLSDKTHAKVETPIVEDKSRASIWISDDDEDDEL